MVENIIIDDERVGVLIKSDTRGNSTEFFTESQDVLQFGHIINKKGHKIPPHIHNPLSRMIVGTPEVLIVKTGMMRVDFYNSNREIQFSKILNKDDVVILLKGGHGFEMLEDTVLIEVKQGPYLGLEDKERF